MLPYNNMANVSYLMVTRAFLVTDTWLTLLTFLAYGNVFLLVGFVASGRRRSWWKHKRNPRLMLRRFGGTAHSVNYAHLPTFVRSADQSSNSSGGGGGLPLHRKNDDTTSATHDNTGDGGVGRGAHRLTWAAFFMLQFFSFNVQSVGQFLSVTVSGACEFDPVAMTKTCDPKQAITAFLYTFDIFLMSVYVYAYITHAKSFFVAVVLRALILAFSITQFSLYISVGSVGAAVIQGSVIGADLVNIWLAWSGRNHTLERLENRLAADGNALLQGELCYDESDRSRRPTSSRSRTRRGTRQLSPTKMSNTSSRARASRRHQQGYTVVSDDGNYE